MSLHPYIFVFIIFSYFNELTIVSLKPKVCAVIFVGPYGWWRSYGRGWSSSEHHCFKRLQFGSEPGYVRTKLIVVLIRRFVAANNHQSLVIDSRRSINFLFFCFLIVHQLMLLVDSWTDEPPVHRLHRLLMLLHLLVNRRWIWTHSHPLWSRLLLQWLVRKTRVHAVVSTDTCSASTAAAAESRRAAR